MTFSDKCVLCGGSGHDTVYSFDSVDIVKCRGCSLVYSIPIPTRAEMQEVYSQDYFETEYNELVAGRHGEEVGSSMMNRIMKHVSSGRFLDVGCGTGDYLATAAARGWECYGVDVSEFSAKISMERSPCKVFTGYLDDAGYETDFFDVGIMVHSLEHQEDPLETLIEMKRIIRPGGVLFVSVPNINSVEARQQGENWHGLQPGVHFYFFGKDTLASMVKKAGFTVIETDVSRNLVSGGSVDKALGGRLGGLVRAVARKLLGGVIDSMRKKASSVAEGEGLTLLATVPKD